MDQGKVDTLQNWPQPTTVKQLQTFLGFTNFYHRFTAQYSHITAPLTSLLHHGSNSLCWTLEAIEAFQSHTDPCLSSWSRWMLPLLESVQYYPKGWMNTQKPNPSAFFSRKHYDIGNHKLLAIKLALEEWWHWLDIPSK